MKVKLESKVTWILVFLGLIFLYGISVLVGEFFLSNQALEVWLDEKYTLKWRDIFIPLFLGLMCLIGYKYFRRKAIS